MEVGDQVRHKKYGLGEVIKVYVPVDRGVRVRFESGHETVCGASRLSAVPQRTTVELPSIQPQQAKRKAASTTMVDYKLLDRAREHFTAQNPLADEVVPRLYGGRAYCEVWTGGHAKIYFYEEENV